MRSLLMERSAGTLARITAAPLRPTQIVLGKLLAIFATGLATIFVIWAVTTLAFGANWGDPLGVVLMCVGATLAVCGIGVFLTSSAKTEQQAFGITMLVGLFLALVGGNLLPVGIAPRRLPGVVAGDSQRVGPVGFGRLDRLPRAGEQRRRSLRGPPGHRPGGRWTGHDAGAQDGRNLDRGHLGEPAPGHRRPSPAHHRHARTRRHHPHHGPSRGRPQEPIGSSPLAPSAAPGRDDQWDKGPC